MATNEYWTVSYLAEGEKWWALGCLIGWDSTNDWCRRSHLDEKTAREVYDIFKKNTLNDRVRLVRVTRKTKTKPADAEDCQMCEGSGWATPHCDGAASCQRRYWKCSCSCQLCQRSRNLTAGLNHEAEV